MSHLLFFILEKDNNKKINRQLNNHSIKQIVQTKKNKHFYYSSNKNVKNEFEINKNKTGFLPNNKTSKIALKQKIHTIPVRIEHGRLKNIKISDGFKAEGSRITTSANRCVLFNILQNKFYVDFTGKTCLDLCCGSGVVGFELLSLGCKECTFIDCDKQKLASINQSLIKTGLTGQTYQCFLPKLPDFNKQFDIIFFDPPYENDFLESTLEQIIKQNLLNKNGILIVETTQNIDNFCTKTFNILQIRELKNKAKFYFLTTK